MRTLLLTIAYFITGFLSVFLQNEPSFLPALVAKGLIIPVLIILLIVNLSQHKDSSYILVLVALAFSWAGDIILEFTVRVESMFMLGLLSFMLAQLIYLTVFFKTPGRNAIVSKRFYLSIPVLLFGTGLLFFLYDDLGVMRIPVLIYAMVILVMLTAAINRIEKVNRLSFLMVLAGAILFVISDSSIAINRFSYPFEASGIVIMSTYILAQYLIIMGYIKQFRADYN
jgi:uncharacterized membrane protein YhhN